MIRVFASGCSAIPHAGHVRLFRGAEGLGDHVVRLFADRAPRDAARTPPGFEAAGPFPRP